MANIKKEKLDEFIKNLRKQRADFLIRLFESKEFLTPEMTYQLILSIRYITKFFKDLEIEE